MAYAERRWKGNIKKIDWKQFGQFLKMVLDLFTTVTSEFKRRKIGPEILEWFTGEGKDAFRKFLTALGDGYCEYRDAQQKAEKSKPLTAEVDLDANPIAPFGGAVRTKHLKQGKIPVEYRPDEDELYVNGRKVVPWFSDAQKAGQIVRGDVLQPEAEKNNPLNATFADWLYEHQEFIPKKCQGNAWYFWATEWENSSVRDRFVRYLYWDGARWNRDCRWLGDDWYGSNPSASLAP